MARRGTVRAPCRRRGEAREGAGQRRLASHELHEAGLCASQGVNQGRAVVGAREGDGASEGGRRAGDGLRLDAVLDGVGVGCGSGGVVDGGAHEGPVGAHRGPLLPRVAAAYPRQREREGLVGEGEPAAGVAGEKVQVGPLGEDGEAHEAPEVARRDGVEQGVGLVKAPAGEQVVRGVVAYDAVGEAPPPQREGDEAAAAREEDAAEQGHRGQEHPRDEAEAHPGKPQEEPAQGAAAHRVLGQRGGGGGRRVGHRANDRHAASDNNVDASVAERTPRRASRVTVST